MKKALFLLLMVLTPLFSFSNEFPSDAWWMSTEETEMGANTWLAFRGIAELDENEISGLEALIAVDSRYWLWINGELVVFEGGLKRGPTPDDTYFDRVQVEKYLKEGENTFAVLVWHFGKQAFSHTDSGLGGLLFWLNNDSGEGSPSIDWKVMEHPAFGETGKPHPNYRLAESNIHFDARNDIAGWTSPEYDEEGWETPVKVAKAGEKPWGELWERPIPLWYDSGLVEYNDIEIQPSGNGNTIVKAYLPKNITITPYLKIKSPAGKIIDIRTDNYRGGGQTNVRTEYVTRDGEQEFETFGYMNGHYVIYTLPEDVEIIDLKYRETRYNTNVVGCFESNDPFYNRFWQKAINTLNVNMRDVIMDCPDRERAQWWGDVVILLGEILYTLDDDGKKAVDKSISNLVEWQKPDGALYSPVPAGNWNQELPGQMLASIGEYGFWYYYYYTGNEDLITYVYPHVKEYLNLWQMKDNGLVEHRKGGWTWLDWGHSIDSTLIYNTWYYMALDAAGKMADVENDQAFARKCRDRMSTIKEAFNREFWTGKGYRSENYPGEYDDRGNGLAVVAGLAGKEKWPAITQVLSNYYNSSPYTEKYILESLFIMDEPELALERMKKRYDKMITSDLTTLWEGWGIGAEGFGGGTYNHAWSGGPLTLMMQYVAGISPGAPGWESFIIAPQMGDLHSVDCKVPTPQGMIKARIRRSEQFFRVKAKVPGNIPGKLVLPVVENPRRIFFNEHLIWECGEKTQGVDQAPDFSVIDDELIIETKGVENINVSIE